MTRDTRMTGSDVRVIGDIKYFNVVFPKLRYATTRETATECQVITISMWTCVDHDRLQRPLAWLWFRQPLCKRMPWRILELLDAEKWEALLLPFFSLGLGAILARVPRRPETSASV
jgi:hypothetical protein